MNCNNYRGISLLDISYKVLSNVLLNKLKPYEDEIVGVPERLQKRKINGGSNTYCQTSNGKMLRI